MTPLWGKIEHQRRNWLQHINRMFRKIIENNLKKTTDQQAEETRGNH